MNTRMVLGAVAALVFLLFLCSRGCVTDASERHAIHSEQLTAAVYEFGCIVSVEKTNQTRVIIPLDKDGKEQRALAYVTGLLATLRSDQCAHVEVIHSN